MTKEKKSRQGKPDQDEGKGQGLKVGGAGAVARGDRKAGLALQQEVRNWVERAVTFLREVRVEFGKVNWPSRKEIIATTSAVAVLSIFFAAFLGLIDITLSKLITLFIY